MPSHVPNPNPNMESFAAATECAACGKELKSKAVSVGAKVKCPFCRQIMLAPAPATQPISEEDGCATALTPVWKVLLPPFLLALILWSTFVLKLHNLDHTALTQWDEVFHAVVAQNVLKHPLKPTLVDPPYLPYDTKKWGENHVWLHKPILPLWQVALSFALFGVDTFTLRLPAAILSTVAAGFTYLIGKELFDPLTAVIAAGLQAANPFLVTLIHGYQFADNIDIALLFWVEVGVYFLVRSLRTGGWPCLLLAGWAQGLAYLCKSYLAFIIFGIALAAWLMPLCRMAKRDDCRIGPRRLITMTGLTVVTAAPWLLYCVVNFPAEFWHEETQVWRHLGTNMEGWAAPWDRVVFDYLIGIYGIFYTPILIAAIVLVCKAFRQRHHGLWLMYAWGLGVFLPHLFAVTKTPSATVLAIPSLLLLLAHLIAEAWRGERWPLVALTAVLIISVAMPAVVRNPGYGFGQSRAFGAIMRQALWLFYHLGGALLILASVATLWYLTRTHWGVAGRYLRKAAQFYCAGMLAWLGFQMVVTAWSITNRDLSDPASVEVGSFARIHLPDNAVLLCDEPRNYEHLTLTFYTGRTCYALPRQTPDKLARQVEDAGGVPYVLTRRQLPLPVIHVTANQGLTVYQWQVWGD